MVPLDDFPLWHIVATIRNPVLHTLNIDFGIFRRHKVQISPESTLPGFL